MKRIRIFGLSMFLLSLSTVNSMWAQPQRYGERKGHRMEMTEPIERLAERLELSDQQKTEIETIHLKSRKTTMRLHSKVEELQAQLNQLLFADNPDQDKITSTIDEIGLLKTDMHKARIFTRLSIRALLSDVQQVKFDLLHEEMPMRVRDRRTPRVNISR